MTEPSRRHALVRGALALLIMSAVPAVAQESPMTAKPTTSLFKIITIKD